MTWQPLPPQGLAHPAFTAARLRQLGVLCLALACFLVLRKFMRAVEQHVPLPIIGHHACPPRVVTYCVTGWQRDWFNVRSRYAIGQAARRINTSSRFRLMEVWCNAPHRIPIFFVARDAHDAWHAGAPYGDAIAHATFPAWTEQHIHVNDSLAFVQAGDTLGQGYDLEALMTHEFLHNLGIEHDWDSAGSIMRTYRYQHLLGQTDENHLRAIERRCIDEDEHDPIEVEPGPGETWRQGGTYRATWRSEFPGPLHVAIYFEGHHAWTIRDDGQPSGSLDIATNTNWRVGAGYQVCVATADWNTIGCSDMFLVAPP